MGIEKYKGRVALVTGASAGIGAAIVQALLKHGLTVVGLARRADNVKALALKDTPGKLHALAGDVSSEESILSAFKWIKENLGGVDVLINNAGVFPSADLTAGKTEDWKRILDVNVLGLSICTREAVRDMLSRGVDDGFIIHINSLIGHVLPTQSSFAMYCASKHAVKALLEGLRKDLVDRGSKIRVGTSPLSHPIGKNLKVVISGPWWEISPGLVKTEGIIRISQDVPKEVREASDLAILEPEDIAEGAIYMLSQHPRIQVYEMIIIPTGTKM